MARKFARALEDLGAWITGLLRGRDYLAAMLSNRGKALLDLKRPEEALASLDRALALKPDHAEAYYYRGNALLNLATQLLRSKLRRRKAQKAPDQHLAQD